MNYCIVTGTSSGIGEAIARKLILDQQHVFCISRTLNESLTELASSTEGKVWHYESDLNETGRIPGMMKDIFKTVGTDGISSLTLINNAGTLGPVTMAGNYNIPELQQHINVNLLAPMILTNEFIRHSGLFNVPKCVVNIGSGAASSAYAGWGPYCSSKAGLEMFTRTTALEQKGVQFPVRIISVLPGIVDTLMQQKIRKTAPGDFPLRSKFEQLYQENKLTSPAEVAEKIVALINGKLQGGSEIIDLRKL